MLEEVKSNRAISTTLSTGSTILVAEATDSEGGTCWGCQITTLEGDVAQICLSDEAFRMFCDGVLQMQIDPELGA